MDRNSVELRGLAPATIKQTGRVTHGRAAEHRGASKRAMQILLAPEVKVFERVAQP